MEDMKKEKEEKKAINQASGKNVDIDFEIMIDKNRFKDKMLQPHISSTAVKVTLLPMQLSVCVRKRPVFKKEEQGGEIDAISCANPQIKIHEPKYKVDGITKYIENHMFTFDNTFNEEEVSLNLCRPMLTSINIR
jgi:kinesin family protein 2/24